MTMTIDPGPSVQHKLSGRSSLGASRCSRTREVSRDPQPFSDDVNRGSKPVADESIRMCYVTDPAELRQSATTEISTSRRGQQHELRSAELVKERRPKGRCELIKSGLEKRRRRESDVGEEWERVRVHARSITTRYPTNTRHNDPRIRVKNKSG